MTVTVYSKPDCPQCDSTRRDLEILGIEYALVDDGRLVGLASETDREALSDATFDYYGRDEHDLLTHDGPFDPRRPRRAMTPVPKPPLDPDFERALRDDG